MRIWTIQKRDVLDSISSDGVYAPDDDKVLASAHDFGNGMVSAYEWLSSRLGAHIGASMLGNRFPVWGYYESSSTFPISPLCSRYELLDDIPYANDEVLIELDIEPDRVVLLPSDDWACILNGWPLPPHDEADVACGIGDDSPFDDGKAKESWDAAMSMHDELLHVDGRVEAVFWEIRKSDVVGTVTWDVVPSQLGDEILSALGTDMDGYMRIVRSSLEAMQDGACLPEDSIAPHIDAFEEASMRLYGEPARNLYELEEKGHYATETIVKIRENTTRQMDSVILFGETENRQIPDGYDTEIEFDDESTMSDFLGI